MNQDLTHVVFILDKSGSMQPLRSDTIGGFNHFIEEQRKQPGEATVTVALFDHNYEVPFDHIDLQALPELTERLYVPEGNTALLDAVGRTINSVGTRLLAMPDDERPGQVVVVIMTDGQENASQEFSHEVVAGMIAHQQNVYKWQFIFLGANIDAKAVATNLNIPASNAVSNAPTREGTQMAYAAVTSSVSSARSGGSAAFEPPPADDEVPALRSHTMEDFFKWSKSLH